MAAKHRPDPRAMGWRGRRVIWYHLNSYKVNLLGCTSKIQGTKKDIPQVVPVISVAQSPSCSCYTHTGLNKASLSSGVAELVVPGSHFLSAGRARKADLGRDEEEESEIARYVSILLQPHIHCSLHPLLPFCRLPLFPPGVNTFPSCLIMFELHLGPVNQPETRAQKRGQGAPSGQ